MPKGGRRAGAGRIRGVPNKKTLERAAEAERELAAAKAEGRETSKSVLEKFMLIFTSMAGQVQPRIGNEAKQDAASFVHFAELAIDCAHKLAPYQFPTFKAIMVAAPPPPQAGDRERIGVEFALTDEVAVARIYREIMTLPASEAAPRLPRPKAARPKGYKPKRKAKVPARQAPPIPKAKPPGVPLDGEVLPPEPAARPKAGPR